MKSSNNSGSGQGLAGIEVTPPIIAVAILVVVLLIGSLMWFGRPGAIGGSNQTLLDAGTETTAPGHAEKHANGMDSSTDSPGAASTNNGMDTGTGR